MPNNIKANQVVREFFDSVGDGLTNIGNSIQDGCAQLAKDFREACTQSTFSKMFDRLFGDSSHFEPRRSDENQNELAKNQNETVKNTGSIVGGEPPSIEDVSPCESPRELPRLNSASLEIPKLITAYRKAEANLKRAEEVFKSISTEAPSTSAQEESDAGNTAAIGAAKRVLTDAQSNFNEEKKNLKSMARHLEPTMLETKRDRIEKAYSEAEELEGKLSGQQVIVNRLKEKIDDPFRLCEDHSWDFALNSELRPKWEMIAKAELKIQLEKEGTLLTSLQGKLAAARKTLDDLKDEVLILSIADEGKYEPHIYELPYSFIDDPEFELKFELSKLNSLEEQHTKMQKRVNAATQQGSRIRNIVAQTESDELLRLIKTKIDTIAQLKQSMRE